MDTEIKAMSLEHIPGVVEAHLESFPGFFLTFLGPAFLREMYSALVEDHHGVCFAALKGKQVVGFVAGTSRSSGVYSRLLRRRLIGFILAIIPAVIKRPGIIPRLLRGVSGPPGQAGDGTGRGRLMSIGVLPGEQGKGLGVQLVRAFLDQAWLHGAEEVDLTTDARENQAVNLFYQRLGFIMEGSFTTPEGREMNQYVIDLDRDIARP